MGLESISEPDDAEVHDEGEVGDKDGEGEWFLDTRSGSPSTSRHEEASEEIARKWIQRRTRPNSRFSIRIPPEGKVKQMDKTVNEGGWCSGR
jgi:hypothetical protein